MFRIRSTYMIVLLSIGGAVSLIGIVSAATTYHFFGVVAGQGGPGQQQQPTPEPQLPTLGPKQPAAPGQPIQSQKLGQQILSPQQQQQLSIQQIKQQQKQDMELLDRIFPYIIQRIDGKTLAQKIDGKTLAQKIDAATLLQKIDDKTLAAKVIPYLDLKVSVVERIGQKVHRGVDLSLSGGKAFALKAYCTPDETTISGGFSTQHGDIYASELYPPNGWQIGTSVGSGESTGSYVNCLTAEPVLREEPRPPPPPPPSQPPGGSPLRPPPEFGK